MVTESLLSETQLESVALGICLATVVGEIGRPEQVATDARGEPIVHALITAVRSVRPSNGGRRRRHANVLELRASGTLGRNLLLQWKPGKRAFVTGELTVSVEGIELHAAQLAWSDGSQGV